MRACIHRGSKQIGGSCLEIKSQGKSLLLDVGRPLDDKNKSAVLPDTLNVSEDTLGILISHYHIDHVGLIGYVSHLPFAMGQASYNIMKAAGPFLKEEYLYDEPTWFLEDSKTFEIGPYEITPYLMDHSAYDAYSFLIKADGMSLFYSGDFRSHGRKSNLLKRLSGSRIGAVDQLLLEGTTLGGSYHEMTTEKELEEKFTNAFKESQGMALVNCSSQNIDRVVTIYRAAKRSGRTLLIDLYSAAILEATGNPRIPQSDWEGIELFIPYRQRVQIKEKELFTLLKGHSRNRVYPDDLVDNSEDKVMLFRPSYLRDRVIADQISMGCFIYSQWKGYLNEGDNVAMLDWINSRAIPFYHIHTSGHASREGLEELVFGLKPETITPIHSFHPEKFKELFSNVTLHNDGEWWDI